MKRRLILLTVLLNFSSGAVVGQYHDFDSLYEHSSSFKSYVDDVADSIDIFHGDDILTVSIESDFKNLMKRKYKDEYQQANFTYQFNDSILIERHIKIKPRGDMRRRVCYYPPLKLNFRKGEMKLKQLSEFDKIKMVRDCKKGKIYQQYLLSEYYAYKIYNLISEYSLRVKLIEVTYIDTSEKYKTEKRYAYLIESIDQLAERKNAIPIPNKNIRDANTDLATLADLYLFQYLIGNTDWSIPARHNMEVIKSKNPILYHPYAIPYDFDYAGIVNTTYAVPDEALGTETVRERVYRGVCIEKDYLMSARQKFLLAKNAIFDLYQSSDLLTKTNLQSTLGYIEDFYQILENDKRFKGIFIDNCRR